MIPSDYQCDGQLNILDFINRPFEITKPIRMIELFAGYGSQSQAMRNIGADYVPYKCVEFDKYAVASFNAIHGTDFPTMDIKEVHGKDLEIVDRDKYCYILFYSFPCTDISVAGQMRGFEQGSETRSALLWEVQRILDELKAENSLPDVCIMENVTAIHSTKNKPSFDKWLNYLKDLGYSTFVQDLNATDYGVAQNRDRTFAVSLLGAYTYKFPEPIELNRCIEDYFEDLTDEQALQLIVKSDKAKALLVELDEKGTLE